MHDTARAVALVTTATVFLAAGAGTAFAGGVGDLLSPAFGTSCTNHGAPAAVGAAERGSGTVGGNITGFALGSPFNHCGGADVDALHDAVSDCGVYACAPWG
ncbi:hypothetical protein [Streptomyces sp. DH12]|uniref:hypothetical protein n=1 Tax=Streptomyces sp. DH12 TaxID=2857010 RepID=UPI001E5D8AD7|nr:hypothetical protein [Streptomyces sp. DH12]